jgi:hypothetical protein
MDELIEKLCSLELGVQRAVRHSVIDRPNNLQTCDDITNGPSKRHGGGEGEKY